MRKRSCVLFVVALLGVSSASVALEPVVLGECPYVDDVVEGFDSQLATLIGLLGSVGVEEVPAPSEWITADMESVLDVMDGDGIPDYYQLGLLGAVLCEASAKATAADVLAQFESNRDLYDLLVADLGALFAALDALADEMADVAALLPTGVGLDDLIAGLLGASALIDGFLVEYGVLPIALGAVNDVFAGLAGLSTEMELTFVGLLAGLMEDIVDPLAEMVALSEFLVIAAGMLGPPLDAPCLALAANIDAALAMALAITPPDFEVYGVTAKDVGEPFSAFGDYNENEDSNLTVFGTVVGDNTPNLRPEFVAAASGANPFYSGNPGLPVAGIAGFVLLVGAVAAGGVLAARKK